MTRDPSDGSVKLTMKRIDQLREKHGPNWGLDVGEAKRKPPEPAPTIEQLIDYYRTNPEAVARLKGDTDWVNPETGQTDLLND